MTEPTTSAAPSGTVGAVVRTWIGLRTSELKEQVMLCYETNGERCDIDGVCPHKAACDAMWLAIRDSANNAISVKK